MDVEWRDHIASVDLTNFYDHCLHLNQRMKSSERDRLHLFECCRCPFMFYEDRNLSNRAVGYCKGDQMKEATHERPERILICIAAGDGTIGSGVVGFAINAVSQNVHNGPFKFSVYLAENIRGYAHMRNTCVKLFLNSPCDRLWFLDEDVVLPANAFELLAVDADIALGPYPSIEEMRPIVMSMKDPHDISAGLCEPPEDGPIQTITACGMGCTIIRRKVLEDRRMWHSAIYTDLSGKECNQADETDALPPVFRFRFKPDGSQLHGEDLDFGLRATRLGYSVKMHTGILCDHVKSIGLNEARRRINNEQDGRRLDNFNKSIEHIKANVGTVRRWRFDGKTE